MKIIRNGKEFVLTAEEVAEAHTEYVVNWMKTVLEDDFNIPHSRSADLAKKAYDAYCKGDGRTEYECIQDTAEDFVRQRKAS